MAAKELVSVNALLDWRQRVKVNHVSDRVVWSDGFDSFTVRFCYTKILLIRLQFFNEGVLHFEWEKLWLKQVLAKISFLLWLIIREKVLTYDCLQRKGFKLASRCELCQCAVEDADSLFISCPFPAQICEYFCFFDKFKGCLQVTFGERLCN